jgi:predicted amidohydrolase
VAQRQLAELTREQGPGTIRVGLLQTAPRFGAADENLADIARLRETIGDVDIAFTPELAAHGYGFDPHDAEDLLAVDDPRLLEVASEGIGIGFAERNPDGPPWNSYLIVDQATGRRFVQRKLHPVSYAPWNEHLLFEPGTETSPADLSGARISTVICNDMWHPVVPWLAAQNGAEVLVVPVASIEGADPERVQRTWQVILEHTALLLQCYVVFVNRCGLDSGVRFWGGSRVVAPDGRTVASLGEDPEAAVVELDLATLRQLRADVPVLAESRADFLAEALAVGFGGGRTDV